MGEELIQYLWSATHLMKALTQVGAVVAVSSSMCGWWIKQHFSQTAFRWLALIFSCTQNKPRSLVKPTFKWGERALGLKVPLVGPSCRGTTWSSSVKWFYGNDIPSIPYWHLRFPANLRCCRWGCYAGVYVDQGVHRAGLCAKFGHVGHPSFIGQNAPVLKWHCGSIASRRNRRLRVPIPAVPLRFIYGACALKYEARLLMKFLYSILYYIFPPNFPYLDI